MFQYDIERKWEIPNMGNIVYVRALIRIKASSIWVKIGFSGISGIDVHALYPVPEHNSRSRFGT